jgi:adenine-specific DNA-methyltransferase
VSSALHATSGSKRLLSAIEQTRLRISGRTAAKRKSQLGQFFTPYSTASFMAGLFPQFRGECRLLDAGAGIGSLSSAFIERFISGDVNLKKVHLKAFEIDSSIHHDLELSLKNWLDQCDFSFEVIGNDFIEDAVNAIQFREYDFTHAILNPPYKKIASNSKSRMLMRRVGIETVNLYSAFVALAVALLAKGGQIVAIVPRSFCNGPYYRPFRDFILERTAIRHIHLFESRNKAFKDDQVLQENVILRLERSDLQGPVTITTSTDDSFSDLATHEHPFERIIFPDDPERFIRIPTSLDKSAIELSPAVRCTLTGLGINISTGPVVDFRLKEFLRDMPEEDTVPLVYPGHLSITGTVWPVQGFKKPNAIVRNEVTEKWFYPNGYYCAVRRFSSKEEKRRIVASVVEPEAFGDHTAVGFENHINLFHDNKRGLPEPLARGLAVFLNTTAVDQHFRRFNGHTQVNATDLKLMKYPSREALIELGIWAKQQSEITQEMIDAQLGKLSS